MVWKEEVWTLGHAIRQLSWVFYSTSPCSCNSIWYRGKKSIKSRITSLLDSVAMDLNDDTIFFLKLKLFNLLHKNMQKCCLLLHKNMQKAHFICSCPWSITRVGKEALFMNCDISPREELQNKANRMTANPPRLVNPSIELQSRWLYELASTPEKPAVVAQKKAQWNSKVINFFTVLLNFILKIRKKHKQVW